MFGWYVHTGHAPKSEGSRESRKEQGERGKVSGALQSCFLRCHALYADNGCSDRRERSSNVRIHVDDLLEFFGGSIFARQSRLVPGWISIFQSPPSVLPSVCALRVYSTVQWVRSSSRFQHSHCIASRLRLESTGVAPDLRKIEERNKIHVSLKVRMPRRL